MKVSCKVCASVCTCILSLGIYGPRRKYVHIDQFLLVSHHIVLVLRLVVAARACLTSVPVYPGVIL